MASAPSAPSSRWLYGPVSDLALGAGFVYLPIFAVLALAGDAVQAVLPASLMPILILLFATPHLGATLIRVYERAEDRRAYRLFALHLTIALAVLFVVGLHVPIVGSVLITLYLTVVPWHFTGQNYGIALVFLRRRGIHVEGTTKRFLYASFVLTFLMTLVALHGRILSDSYAPLETSGTIYQFLALGIPGQVQAVALLLLAAAYVYVLFETLVRLRRLASWRDLGPSLCLVFTQALWYSIPILIHFVLSGERLGPFAPSNHGYTFIWVSLTHAVQYLWITTYTAERQQPGLRRAPYLGRALLAGAAIYGLPTLALAPGLLGRLPYDSGLFLMVAGALNLHHVLLDSAIWKLRNGRIARILLRPAESAVEAVPGRSWVRPLVWTSGFLGAAITLVGTWEVVFGVQQAAGRGDLVRVEQAVQRLSWMGRDGPVAQTTLGTLRAQQGDVPGALAALERSLALQPTAPAWINIGVLHEQQGRLPAALLAYEEAVALDPDDPTALYYAGRASLLAGKPGRAKALLEQAVALAPNRSEIRRELRRARKRLAAAAQGPASRLRVLP
ncbi:MAG: tetratricopeptide repeat protein [Proteobacteria bacterium]|nr:tetratricopeptide repeat protein [Pseudomonadota bacterium]